LSTIKQCSVRISVAVLNLLSLTSDAKADRKQAGD